MLTIAKPRCGRKGRDYSTAIAAYTKGASLGDIGQSMGVSRQAVWLALRGHGVAMRPHAERGEKNHFHRGGERAIQAARQSVKRAVRSGKLIKQPCECCGSDHAIRAHHDDYGKPLDVRWLCAACHFEWHTKNRAKLPGEQPVSETANRRY
jgi:hypothetical protein